MPPRNEFQGRKTFVGLPVMEDPDMPVGMVAAFDAAGGKATIDLSNPPEGQVVAQNGGEAMMWNGSEWVSLGQVKGAQITQVIEDDGLDRGYGFDPSKMRIQPGAPGPSVSFSWTDDVRFDSGLEYKGMSVTTDQKLPVPVTEMATLFSGEPPYRNVTRTADRLIEECSLRTAAGPQTVHVTGKGGGVTDRLVISVQAFTTGQVFAAEIPLRSQEPDETHALFIGGPLDMIVKEVKTPRPPVHYHQETPKIKNWSPGEKIEEELTITEHRYLLNEYGQYVHADLVDG